MISDIICTVIGVCVDVFILYIYSSIYKIKTSKYKALFLYLVYGIVTLLMNVNEIKFAFKLSLNIILTIALLKMIYENITVFAAIINSVIFFTLLGIGEIFTIPVTFICYDVYDIDIFYTDSLTLLWIETLLISRTISVILIKHFDKYRTNTISIQSKLEKIVTYFPLVVTFSIFIIIEHSLIYIENSSIEDIIVVLIVISILMMSYSILHLKLFESILKIKRQDLEILELKHCNELQYKYYEDKNYQDNEIRRFYHDMKNHILMIQEAENSNSKIYKENLLKDLSNYETTICSGSKVFDILVNAKKKEAEPQGINFEILVRKNISCINFIDERDQCSIFGNLLDNAIENSIKCDQPQIKLCIDVVNNFFVLVIKNTYVPSDLNRSGRFFLTTKNDKQNHGIGLQSVKYSVEKYDGILKITNDQTYFDVKIMIPIPRNE